jgi:WD40 repeat protein
MWRFLFAVCVAAAVGCGSSGKHGECLRTMHGHAGDVCAVAFSPDGKWLVSGGADGNVGIWDVETGECTRTIVAHKEWVHSVAPSPDGRAFASGGRDGLVKLWDAETGELRKSFAGHSGIVFSVAYSPDGRSLASCAKDPTARMWDVASGECLKSLPTESFVGGKGVAFSADGKQVLFAGLDLQLFDVETGRRLRTFHGHSDSLNGAALSLDGKRAASVGEYTDRTLRVWDVKSGECLWMKDFGENQGAWCVIFAAQDTVVVSGHSNGAIRFWDAASGTPVGTVAGHANPVSCLAVDPEGKYLASGGWDKLIKIWKAPPSGSDDK